ncbi:unnamed protein product [Darwinula stevensoni]|uniref:Uncharacterized protein n=1 Tax=Darwinula stevensoni TaxID=69355 RepID=A0A7R8XFN5_9CRUS|nr:unnamed protein product [Darwinula stevensoni]CAG0888993.1 unnamed protein product [Darwinula stevensoni]
MNGTEVLSNITEEGNVTFPTFQSRDVRPDRGGGAGFLDEPHVIFLACIAILAPLLCATGGVLLLRRLWVKLSEDERRRRLRRRWGKGRESGDMSCTTQTTLFNLKPHSRASCHHPILRDPSSDSRMILLDCKGAKSDGEGGSGLLGFPSVHSITVLMEDSRLVVEIEEQQQQQEPEVEEEKEEEKRKEEKEEEKRKKEKEVMMKQVEEHEEECKGPGLSQSDGSLHYDENPTYRYGNQIEYLGGSFGYPCDTSYHHQRFTKARAMSLPYHSRTLYSSS